MDEQTTDTDRYEAPRVTRLGSLAELTQGVKGNKTDALMTGSVGV